MEKTKKKRKKNWQKFLILMDIEGGHFVVTYKENFGPGLTLPLIQRVVLGAEDIEEEYMVAEGHPASCRD